VDYIYQNHAQNIVVPGGTKFNNDHESTKDRLERFIFNEKNPDIFDKKRRCVYSKIIEKENKAGIKKYIL
jgi:hypothetical protein